MRRAARSRCCWRGYSVSPQRYSGSRAVGLWHSPSQPRLPSHHSPLPPLEMQGDIVAEIEGYQKVIDGARAVVDNYRPYIPVRGACRDGGVPAGERLLRLTMDLIRLRARRRCCAASPNTEDQANDGDHSESPQARHLHPPSCSYI